MTLTCVKCQTPVPEDAKFCHSCGSDVSDAEGQAAITASLGESATKKMEDLLREATTGEFKIHQMLGRGGMTAVYLATELHLNRKVAIKVLPPELTYGHGVQRFVREARTAASLDHPNIIPIYRVSNPEGSVFWYAMKYLPGMALDDFIREKGRVPVDQTIALLMQVADALDYGHERHVVHRDIKPANIMLGERGRVTVTDFGIAKAVSEGTITASGAVVGTPSFMSPEQATGVKIGPPSDQYSTAVMAYQMLSGHLPFEGTSAIDVLHKLCMEPPAPLRELAPNLPKPVYPAIARAMAKDPDNRFANVTAFVKAMGGDWGGEPEYDENAATEIMPGRPSLRALAATPKKKKKRKGLIFTLFVLAAGGGGGGYWYWDNQQTLLRQAETERLNQIALAARQDSINALPPPPATLVVAGLPAGGQVEINGEPQDTSAFELVAGAYAIRLAAPQYQPTLDTVTLREGQADTLVFYGSLIPRQGPVVRTPARPTTGVLIAFTTGSWATISVDGVAKTDNNRFREDLLPGRHLLRFARDGYVTVDTTIIVVAGDTIRLEIAMQPGGEW